LEGENISKPLPSASVTLVLRFEQKGTSETLAPVEGW
jgi:hypothetical protein